MKNFDVPEKPESDKLEFPDWSGMNDSPARIRPEVAVELTEEYLKLFPEAAKHSRKFRREKCEVEFVL